MIHKQGGNPLSDSLHSSEPKHDQIKTPQPTGSAKINRDFRLEREADILAAKALLRHSPEISSLN